MKITKRQLKRIIKEEKRRLHELGISRGERLPVDVETLWGDVEGALDSLTTVLSQMEDIDPQHASDAVGYVIDTLQGWKR
tara:strand:+ start:207 stop:446 length:240 start_codon:yes stop_codon:yes gene_type:complete